jgi:hypothetical protein
MNETRFEKCPIIIIQWMVSINCIKKFSSEVIENKGLKNLGIKKAAKTSGLKKDLGNELLSNGYLTLRRS